MSKSYQIVDKIGRGKSSEKDEKAVKTFFPENGRPFLKSPENQAPETLKLFVSRFSFRQQLPTCTVYSISSTTHCLRSTQ